MKDEEGILTILLVQGCCRCCTGTWTGPAAGAWCCGPSHHSSEYNEIQQSFHCQTSSSSSSPQTSIAVSLPRSL